MYILNSIQSREYKRAQTVAGFFTNEKETCLLYPPFNDEVTSFFLNNKKLLSLVPDRGSNGKIITDGKDFLKALIATNANIICTRTAAYAIKIGDKDLEAAVYYRTSEIGKLKDADVLGFVTRLSTIITPLLAKPDFLPYAVTGDMLATVTQDGTDFNNSIGKASLADSKSSYISDAINEVLKAIRGNIVQFNLLLNFFEEKYPGFVKSYYTAVAIDESGIRHNGIRGVITNSRTGQPAEKVVVTLTGKTKTKNTTTDSDGAYEIIKFMSGKCKLTITAPGYESQTVEVTIIRSKIIELNITLQVQSVNMATA